MPHDPLPTIRTVGARGRDRVPAASDPLAAESLERSRELRSNLSLPEVLLWTALRGSRVLGLRFRRQHVLGPYIADFFCHEVRLVVEVDGRCHESRRDDDRRRDEWMIEQGLTVARIPARIILESVAQAVEIIAREAVALKPSVAGRQGGRKTR